MKVPGQAGRWYQGLPRRSPWDIGTGRQIVLGWLLYRVKTTKFYPKLSKVEDAPDPRHQGRSRSRLLQVLDNEGDGVSSAFPQGKQNGIFLIHLNFIYRRVMKMHLNSLKCIINKNVKYFPILFTINQGFIIPNIPLL